MNSRNALTEISGRMILPSGVAFLMTALTPLVIFIAPTGRHLWPALLTEQFSWVWFIPLVSGIVFLVLVIGLELKKK